MKIKLTESQYKRIILEQTLSPKEQLDKFDFEEDKVKSAFLKKKSVKNWLSYLENKYPDLKFRFQYGNEVLIAKAEIKN
jgi:hypothetical protein